MGFFSWRCAVSEHSLSNLYSSRGPTPFVLVMPDNTHLKEMGYEGYGDVAGQDAYALLDQMNGGEGDRIRGIDREGDFFSGKAGPDFKPLKFVALDHFTGQRYEDLPPSPPCQYQGYFYDFYD